MNLAGYYVAIDDLPNCIRSAQEAIRELAPRDPSSAWIAASAEHLALALALQGDLRRAALLSGYAEAALQNHGVRRQSTERTTYDRLVVLLRERIANSELAALLGEGATLSADAAIALALESDNAAASHPGDS